MPETLRIAVTGSTGLIGSALVRRLQADGHQVTRVVRSRPAAGSSDVLWNPDSGEFDAARLDGYPAVIHLAGEPVSERWTAEHKAAIRNSRVAGTRLLAEGIAALPNPPGTLLSASAVGYYGNRGDEQLDEASGSGNDFLSGVAREWEAATEPAARVGIRVVIARFGIALSPKGGALARLLPPFKMGGGGKLGSGKQYVSWIALSDLVEAIVFLLHHPAISGPVNLTAPEPVTNAAMSETLGHVLGRPSKVTVPAFALRMMFGEMADGALLASQRVLPKRLLEAGFQFRYPRLEAALRAELAADS
jgi:uncharacterized protein (TIGR01777 family)